MSRAPAQRRNPVPGAATAAGEFSKKNNRRPGQTLGRDSPDRRQRIKISSKSQSEHTPLRPCRRCREPQRSAATPYLAPPPRPANSAKRTTGGPARRSATGPPPTDKDQLEKSERAHAADR